MSRGIVDLNRLYFWKYSINIIVYAFQDFEDVDSIKYLGLVVDLNLNW